jgi:hypothetical protein
MCVDYVPTLPNVVHRTGAIMVTYPRRNATHYSAEGLMSANGAHFQRSNGQRTQAHFLPYPVLSTTTTTTPSE